MSGSCGEWELWGVGAVASGGCGEWELWGVEAVVRGWIDGPITAHSPCNPPLEVCTCGEVDKEET